MSCCWLQISSHSILTVAGKHTKWQIQVDVARLVLPELVQLLATFFGDIPTRVPVFALLLDLV